MLLVILSASDEAFSCGEPTAAAFKEFWACTRNRNLVCLTSLLTLQSLDEASECDSQVLKEAESIPIFAQVITKQQVLERPFLLSESPRHLERKWTSCSRCQHRAELLTFAKHCFLAEQL
mmetsp:Transcript_44411/g.92899  ORF Transcript_44411/g.92899 Transcript_44411/m.92899 type:complete len:120 (+) Transcript_44411:944-1303(+)